jgi:hypothetical protein
MGSSRTKPRVARGRVLIRAANECLLKVHLMSQRLP